MNFLHIEAQRALRISGALDGIFKPNADMIWLERAAARLDAIDAVEAAQETGQDNSQPIFDERTSK